MIKKIIIVLIIICLALALWFFRDFFLMSKEVVVQKDLTKEESKEEGQKKTILEDIVAVGEIKMALKKDKEKIIYYNQNNFLEVDLKNSYKKTISSFPFKGLKDVSCSKSGKFCLVQTGDKFSIYNLELKQNIELKEEIKELKFNFQEDGLIYLFFQDGEYQLNSSDLKGENWIKSKKISGENINISVSPQENQVAYFSRKADKTNSGIFLTNFSNKQPTLKIVEDDIIDILWSPLGNRVLFSFYDHSVTPKRVQLGYYDLDQKKQYELGLPSISQKCVWSEDSYSLYCAALTSTSLKGFSLEDWYSREFISQDIFWKIDLKNSQKERVFNDLEKYPQVDVFNLILLEDEILFIDKISGNLIRRKL